jgi:hypothetical protein
MPPTTKTTRGKVTAARKPRRTRLVKGEPELTVAEATLARIKVLLAEMRESGDPAALAVIDRIEGGMGGYVAEPEILIGRTTVAGWVSDETGLEVKSRAITDMMLRYPADRTPAELARTPAVPQPDFYGHSEGGRLFALWRNSEANQRAWKEWARNRPGNGAAGFTRKPRTAAEA